MDYELTKQLKDAGFPQEVLYGGYVIRERDRLRFNIGNSDDMGETTGGYNPNFHRENTTTKEGYVKVPTLSELIEACGEGFGNLRRGHEGNKALNCDIETWETGRDKVLWQCNAEFEEGRLGGWSWDSEGETPEEAVAKLWLNLKQTSKE